MFSWRAIKVIIQKFLETKPPFKNNAHLRAWQKYVRDQVRDKQLYLFNDKKYQTPTPEAEPYIFKPLPIAVGRYGQEDNHPVVYVYNVDEKEDREFKEPYIFMYPDQKKMVPFSISCFTL